MEQLRCASALWGPAVVLLSAFLRDFLYLCVADNRGSGVRFELVKGMIETLENTIRSFFPFTTRNKFFASGLYQRQVIS